MAKDLEEIWKNIPDFDFYQAPSLGRIRSISHYGYVKNGHKAIHHGKIIKPRKQNGGYLIVWLRQSGKTYAKTVHRLIAETFIPKIADKEFVNHKDGDKTNNIVKNLEWCNRSENEKHSYKYLGHKKNSIKVLCVDTNIAYESLKEAGLDTGANPKVISNVIKGIYKTAGGYRWKKV